MRLEYQILTAVAIDLVVGDPRWLPHPVRGIGWLAGWLEALSRRMLGATRLAGLLAALGTYLLVGLATWGAICLAAAIHPWAADAVAIFAIYTTIAARDLARHSMAVYRPLVSGNLGEARRRVAAIVGRDTEQLDEAGVVRAAVESVAESTVDGVTAPLFFAAIAGPVGAMVYRAVNTLDSMFGHEDDRYREFGWAAARIDDLGNYLPARLTAPLICLAAAIISVFQRLVSALKPEAQARKVLSKLVGAPSSLARWASVVPAAHALRTLLRDGRKHASPNSGLAEAAMAGALGVQLGGTNYYDGQPLEKPTIGDPLVPLSPRHIPRANALMFLASGLFLAAGLGLRAGTLHLWHAWRTAG